MHVVAGWVARCVQTLAVVIAWESARPPKEEISHVAELAVQEELDLAAVFGIHAAAPRKLQAVMAYYRQHWVAFVRGKVRARRGDARGHASPHVCARLRRRPSLADRCRPRPLERMGNGWRSMTQTSRPCRAACPRCAGSSQRASCNPACYCTCARAQSERRRPAPPPYNAVHVYCMHALSSLAGFSAPEASACPDGERNGPVFSLSRLEDGKGGNLPTSPRGDDSAPQRVRVGARRCSGSRATEVGGLGLFFRSRSRRPLRPRSECAVSEV